LNCSFSFKIPVDQLMLYELRNGVVWFLVRWRSANPTMRDSWISEQSLMKEESGRMAIAYYRHRRAQIERLPIYSLVGRFRRQTPLPAISPEDAKRMPSSLRVLELANQAAPAAGC
jgi:hypothetical protein